MKDWKDRKIEHLERKVDALQFYIDEIRGTHLQPPEWFQVSRGKGKAFEIVNTLAASAPRVMNRQALLSACYPSIEQPVDKIIDVWVCLARKHLRGRGIEIKTVWGVGYRMSVDHAAIWNAEVGRAALPAPVTHLEDAA